MFYYLSFLHEPQYVLYLLAVLVTLYARYSTKVSFWHRGLFGSRRKLHYELSKKGELGNLIISDSIANISSNNILANPRLYTRGIYIKYISSISFKRGNIKTKYYLVGRINGKLAISRIPFEYGSINGIKIGESHEVYYKELNDVFDNYVITTRKGDEQIEYEFVFTDLSKHTAREFMINLIFPLVTAIALLIMFIILLYN